MATSGSVKPENNSPVEGLEILPETTTTIHSYGPNLPQPASPPSDPPPPKLCPFCHSPIARSFDCMICGLSDRRNS